MRAGKLTTLTLLDVEFSRSKLELKRIARFMLPLSDVKLKILYDGSKRRILKQARGVGILGSGVALCILPPTMPALAGTANGTFS